jgi:hypothetical protein
MFYGEHLSADEVSVRCACGVIASVEVVDKYKQSCGWFCRRCSYRKRAELKRQEKIAKAIVRKGVRR